MRENLRENLRGLREKFKTQNPNHRERKEEGRWQGQRGWRRRGQRQPQKANEIRHSRRGETLYRSRSGPRAGWQKTEQGLPQNERQFQAKVHDCSVW